MASPTASPLNSLWSKWKALKLPWRKRWLAGTDLAGNTYWYFKPVSAASRARRILQHNPKIPYSDIQIPPQWHQWLRYTRPTPPTISEQQADVTRQRELKYLVQAADERWAAKPSVLDSPRQGNLQLGVRDAEVKGTVETSAERLKNGVAEETVPKEKRKENPWKVKQGNPGEGWQPQAWAPGPGPSKS